MYEKLTLFEYELLAIWDVTLGEHWFNDDVIGKSYDYIYGAWGGVVVKALRY